MQITQIYDPLRCVTKYELEISDFDLINSYDRFTAWDKLLLQDCGKSESIADWLLGLETVVRKIEEAYGERQKEQAAQKPPSDETKIAGWFIAV